MKNLLLSNIGNRNLMFDDKFITEDFLNVTQHLYEDYEEQKGRLKLNIINKLIEHELPNAQAFDEVILFASAQKNSRNDQDTQYAAQLVANLINEQYGIKCTVLTMNCSVVNHNQLIRNYKRLIGQLKAERGDECHYWLSDSGGTAQQKSSLRVVLHFLVSSDDISILQALETTKGASTVEQSEAVEYQKILQAESIEAFIAKLNYIDGLKLLNTGMKSAMNSKNPMHKLLCIGQLLLSQQKETADKVIANLPKGKNLDGIIEKYKGLNIFDEFEEAISAEMQIELSLFLHKCKYYYKNSMASANELIMALQHFVELYLPAFIDHNLGYSLSNASKYEQEVKRLDSNIRKEYPELIKKYGNYRIPGSVMGKIDIAATIEHLVNAELLNWLRPVVSDGSEKWDSGRIKSLNGYRNDIAHRARTFSIDHVKRNWPVDFDQWMQGLFDIFDFYQPSIFDELNHEIMILIKK